MRHKRTVRTQHLSVAKVFRMVAKVFRVFFGVALLLGTFWWLSKASILYFSLVFCSLDVAHVLHSFIVQQVWMCAGCQSVYVVWCECLTSAVWAHSPVQAGAAAPSVWHHRCPPISCGDAPRERWPHASTPSEGGGGGTAWGRQKTASLFPIHCCVNIATIFHCIHCCTKLQWFIVLS